MSLKTTKTQENSGKSKEDVSKHRPALHTALGGSLSGMFAVTMSYPFDLIKTRMHFEVGNINSTVKPNQFVIGKLIYQEGTRNTLLGSRALSGFASFYRGLDQLLPEAAFKVLLRFVLFEEVQKLYRKNILHDVNATMPFVGNIFCGAVAGAIEATLIVQPFERGKTLRADFASPFQVVGDMYKRRGLRAAINTVYVGYLPCMGRQVGNQATSFSVFYTLKNNYLAWSKNADLGTFERLSFGFIGGCAGACVTMPLDVTKSIAQKQQGEKVISTTQILLDVFRRKGIRGLYAGLPPRLLRVGLDRAFGFWAYEFIMSRLDQRRLQSV